MGTKGEPGIRGPIGPMGEMGSHVIYCAILFSFILFIGTSWNKRQSWKHW